MAVTPLDENAEIKSVTLFYNDATGMWDIVVEGKVWKGRLSSPAMAATSTSDLAMVGTDATFNDVIADLNDLAVAFNV